MERGLSERDRAKQVICAIIDAAGGRVNGKLRLYKAFYYAHLIYFQNGPGIVLTGYPIVKMPMGPGIDNATELLGEMQDDGMILIEARTNGEYDEFVFTLKGSNPISQESPEYDAVKQAADIVKGKTAKQLSDETHTVSRSWRDAANGDELNIYVDPMSDDEFRQMKQTISNVKKTLVSA
jgi:hypothetical protein